MVIGLRKIVGFAAALACAVVTSQAPEFAQQYRQRLGGALQELAEVITAFDEDAAAANMQRGEALATMERAESTFLRDRGDSMRRAMGRFDSLSRQAGAFAEMPPVLRPVAVVRGADAALLRGTAMDFEPAVPITPHGLAWAGAGFLFGFATARLAMRVLRRRPGASMRGRRA